IPRPVGEAPRARRSDRPPRRSPSGEFPAYAPIPPPPKAPAPEPEPVPEPPAAEVARASAPEPEPAPQKAAAATVAEPPEIQTLSATAADQIRGIEDPEPTAEPIPKPRGRSPRMVSLTLLDGTTITLPARKRKRDDDRERPRPKRAGSEDDIGLT